MYTVFVKSFEATAGEIGLTVRSSFKCPSSISEEVKTFSAALTVQSFGAPVAYHM